MKKTLFVILVLALFINTKEISAQQHGMIRFPTYGDCSDGNLNVTGGVVYTDNVRAKLKYVSTSGLYYGITWENATGTFNYNDRVMLINMDNGRYCFLDLDSSYGSFFLGVNNFSGGTGSISWGDWLSNFTHAGPTGSGLKHCQIIRVPQYSNVDISGGEITCHPWDSVTGTGGVVAFLVCGTLHIYGTGKITANGKGFIGGPGGNGGNGGINLPNQGLGGVFVGGDGQDASGTTLGASGNPYDVIIGVCVGASGVGGDGTQSFPGNTGMIGFLGNTAGNSVYSPNIQYAYFTFGSAGNGGDGGQGPGAGGNGGGGGAGVTNGLDGILGNAASGNGGNGGNGGAGGGAIFIRASIINGDPGRINFQANGTNGSNGTDASGQAGNGGDGGNGGNMGCDNGLIVPAGGGGGYGIGGDGGDGGNGGDAGYPGTVWLMYQVSCNLTGSDIEVRSGNPGIGGNPVTYGNDGTQGSQGARISLGSIPCNSNCGAHYGINYTHNKIPCDCDSVFELLTTMDGPTSYDPITGKYKFTSTTSQNYCIYDTTGIITAFDYYIVVSQTDTNPGQVIVYERICHTNCNNKAFFKSALYYAYDKSSWSYDDDSCYFGSEGKYAKISRTTTIGKIYDSPYSRTPLCETEICNGSNPGRGIPKKKPGKKGKNGNRPPDGVGEIHQISENEIYDYAPQLTNIENTGNSLRNSILIIPNPVNTGVLHLRYTIPERANVQIIVRDMLGHILIQTRHTGLVGTNDMGINVSALSSGCYILEFKTNKNAVQKQFIKL